MKPRKFGGILRLGEKFYQLLPLLEIQGEADTGRDFKKFFFFFV